MASSTPWGSAQQVTHIAHGIRSVSTSGHGGVLVSPSKNVLIPEYMRRNDGAYEEDCDWAIPAIVFEKEWRSWADSTDWTSGQVQLECAWSTFLNWHPDAYEKFTGKKLQAGESYLRDEQLLKAETRDQYVVKSAWGDWQKGVPKEMVGVAAYRASDGDCKYFTIPAVEYRERSNKALGKASCFVVMPDRHSEVAPLV
jgi:hypothetical protein